MSVPEFRVRVVAEYEAAPRLNRSQGWLDELISRNENESLTA